MFETSIKASRKLFREFLSNLLRLSLSFFEQTPIGRIINRCSFDFDMIDNDMIFTLRSTLNALFGFIICFVVIAFYLPETIPIMLIIFTPFLLLEVNKNEYFFTKFTLNENFLRFLSALCAALIFAHHLTKCFYCLCSVCFVCSR